MPQSSTTTSPAPASRTQAAPKASQRSTPATASSTTQPQPSSADSPLSPSAPVITVTGVCNAAAPSLAHPAPASASKTAADCRTIITRADFDKLVQAVNPRMPPAGRRTMANTYVQLLALSSEAQKRGMDRDPMFQEQMRIVRLRILAEALQRRMQEQLSQIPEADLQKYYQDNLAAYDEITLRRIYIPRKMEGEAKPENAESAAEALADTIRKRAAAGEDMDKLQQEVFTLAKLNTPPPSTVIGAKRHGALPPAHEEQVFALKPAEVSPVMKDASALYIYRADAKRTLPLDQVKSEIQQTLQRQRFQDEMNRITGSVRAEMNDTYFAEGEPGASAPAHPGGPGATPPAGAPPAAGKSPATSPPPPK